MSKVSEAALKTFVAKLEEEARADTAILSTSVLEGEIVEVGDVIKVMSGPLLFTVPIAAVWSLTYTLASGGSFEGRLRVRKDADLTMEAAVSPEQVSGLLTGDVLLQVRRDGLKAAQFCDCSDCHFCQCTECVCQCTECICGVAAPGRGGDGNKKFRQSGG
ncbi:hypothetical protein [Nannocystis pusilla]|uniref:hypothetical protein n=1 Tax=Nannocystis pusilla TaxID=889268 RepID=UPI003BEFBD0B